MNNPVKILSTKQLRNTSLERLRQDQDIEYMESAFIETTALRFTPPDLLIDDRSRIAVVFTSGAAVTSVAASGATLSLKLMDVFCLSGYTKELVIANWGIDCIRGIADNAAGLAKAIVAAKKYQTVLFFCGSSRRDTLPELLRSKGMNVQEVNVYTTRLTPHKIAVSPDVVLFFSPSAVHSFFSLNQLPDTVICCAIGATTAISILEYGKNYRIIASPYPDQDVLLRQLFKHLQLLLI